MAIKFLSVILAALVPMSTGFIWYHDKVFGQVWRNELGLTPERLKRGNMAVLFGLTLLMSLIMAFGQTTIAVHDSFVSGATYYINESHKAEPGSEPARWLEYYQANLADSNHRFSHGAVHGLLIAGFLVVVPALVTDGLFERRSVRFILVKIGFWLLNLMLMGGIIASMAR